MGKKKMELPKITVINEKTLEAVKSAIAHKRDNMKIESADIVTVRGEKGRIIGRRIDVAVTGTFMNHPTKRWGFRKVRNERFEQMGLKFYWPKKTRNDWTIHFYVALNDEVFAELYPKEDEEVVEAPEVTADTPEVTAETKELETA